jgi:Family of unknown function (DUF6220)
VPARVQLVCPGVRCSPVPHPWGQLHYFSGWGYQGAGFSSCPGAFSFHNARASGRDSAWDPHRTLDDILVLISLLQLLLALAARLPRPLLLRAGALFVLMIVQYTLAQLGDSTSTLWIAALHPVNALAITGIAIGIVIEGRAHLPIARIRPTAASAHDASG